MYLSIGNDMAVRDKSIVGIFDMDNTSTSKRTREFLEKNRAEANAVSIYEYNEEEHMKQFSYEICQKHKVVIRYMETDKDHIHYMIETEPTMSISKIVNLMKSYTTYHIWERYPNYLRKHFWKEHTFWTDGYFACSVGNV